MPSINKKCHQGLVGIRGGRLKYTPSNSLLKVFSCRLVAGLSFTKMLVPYVPHRWGMGCGEATVVTNDLDVVSYEPRCEKTSPRCF